MLWARQLHGRSGVGFGALAPLSHTVVKAWMELYDHRLEQYEIDALFELDAAMMVDDPEPEEEEEAPPPEERRPRWPTKKKQ